MFLLTGMISRKKIIYAINKGQLVYRMYRLFVKVVGEASEGALRAKEPCYNLEVYFFCAQQEWPLRKS